MDIPFGTVTFLFTDIEGSTKIWEKYPDKMSVALARHDELLSQIIQHHNGYVFKTVGDAYCASFEDVVDAINASVGIQTAIQLEQWPEYIKIRVRTALHGGSVQVRNNDYFGQALNRVSRLLSVCHGEQIIISDVVRMLSIDNLPDGCTLKLLGEHNLKDLGRSEVIYQLCAPGIRSEFPKLLSTSCTPNNLPNQVTSFVGRENEIKEIASLLANTHLLTFTGTGGCGKTRLSIELGSRLIESFADGVWFVEMAPLRDVNLVSNTVANVLGINQEAGKSIQETLIDNLKSKKLLLIFDNCEHLLKECASLADAIQRTCKNVAIIASSREALGVVGEQCYHVPSLSMPDSFKKTDAKSLIAFESIHLFVSRAKLYDPHFDVTDKNSAALISICRRLDGIPLAIELAAARVRFMTVEEIDAKLDEKFDLLTGGSDAALPRHQTIESLIDWSYDLLNEQEKALICRMSVFSGGCNLEAAENICSDDMLTSSEICDTLNSLVDKSLVKTYARSGVTRYRLLDTVQLFSKEKLEQSGERDIWRDRHLEYFVTLAESISTELFSPKQSKLLDLFDTDRDNIRVALAWSLKHNPDSNYGTRIIQSVWKFWYVKGHVEECKNWLDELIANPTKQTSEIREWASGALKIFDEHSISAIADKIKGAKSMRLLKDSITKLTTSTTWNTKK